MDDTQTNSGLPDNNSDNTKATQQSDGSTYEPAKPAPSLRDSDEYGDNDESTAADQITDLPAEEKQTIGKLKQEQERNKQLSEELKKYKQDADRLQTIVQNAMKSEDKYRRALIEYSGWNENDADAYIEQIKQAGQAPAEWSQTPSKTGNVQDTKTSVDPFKAAEQVFQAKMQAEKVQRAFFERVPELSPDNIPADKLEGVQSFVTAIEYEARRRVMQNPQADFVDTLVTVYKDFTGKTDEQITAAREEGRIEGMLQNNINKASSTKSSKGFVAKENTFGLTADQIAQAQAEGLSLERFAELIKSNETTVG